MKGDITNSVTTGKLATPVHNVSPSCYADVLSSEFLGCPLSWPEVVARLGVESSSSPE